MAARRAACESAFSGIGAGSVLAHTRRTGADQTAGVYATKFAAVVAFPRRPLDHAANRRQV